MGVRVYTATARHRHPSLTPPYAGAAPYGLQSDQQGALGALPDPTLAAVLLPSRDQGAQTFYRTWTITSGPGTLGTSFTFQVQPPMGYPDH